MLAMILATLGWAAWWVALCVVKVAPGSADVVVVAATVASGLCALPGLLIAALTVRARRTWMLFVLVPLFANGALLLMPWLASGIIERGS
jgi:hypothetical protein